MKDKISDLIRRLNPGKNFIGLWVYRQRGFRTKRALWTVTFFDDEGEYGEIRLQKTPEAALREAMKILKATARQSLKAKP